MPNTIRVLRNRHSSRFRLRRHLNPMSMRKRGSCGRHKEPIPTLKSKFGENRLNGNSIRWLSLVPPLDSCTKSQAQYSHEHIGRVRAVWNHSIKSAMCSNSTWHSALEDGMRSADRLRSSRRGQLVRRFKSSSLVPFVPRHSWNADPSQTNRLSYGWNTSTPVLSFNSITVPRLEFRMLPSSTTRQDGRGRRTRRSKPDRSPTCEGWLQ